MHILPISAGIACVLSSGNKVLRKMIKEIFNYKKKQKQKDQQTFKPFDKVCRKILEENLLEKKNLNLSVIVLLGTLMK